MPVTAPTPDQLKQIASDVGLSLTEDDVASFIALMKPAVDAYNVVDRLPDNLPRVKYPRVRGYRPPPGRTSTTPGTTRRGWRARARESSRAGRSCSRTTSCSPACR
jgi:hypothetical protein